MLVRSHTVACAPHVAFAMAGASCAAVHAVHAATSEHGVHLVVARLPLLPPLLPRMCQRRLERELLLYPRRHLDCSSSRTGSKDSWDVGLISRMRTFSVSGPPLGRRQQRLKQPALSPCARPLPSLKGKASMQKRPTRATSSSRAPPRAAEQAPIHSVLPCRPHLR